MNCHFFLEHETAHQVRWTWVLRGPERSGDLELMRFRMGL